MDLHHRPWRSQLDAAALQAVLEEMIPRQGQEWEVGLTCPTVLLLSLSPTLFSPITITIPPSPPC
jgi:hypothetical protein